MCLISILISTALVTQADPFFSLSHVLRRCVSVSNAVVTQPLDVPCPPQICNGGRYTSQRKPTIVADCHCQCECAPGYDGDLCETHCDPGFTGANCALQVTEVRFPMCPECLNLDCTGDGYTGYKLWPGLYNSCNCQCEVYTDDNCTPLLQGTEPEPEGTEPEPEGGLCNWSITATSRFGSKLINWRGDCGVVGFHKVSYTDYTARNYDLPEHNCEWRFGLLNDAVVTNTGQSIASLSCNSGRPQYTFTAVTE